MGGLALHVRLARARSGKQVHSTAFLRFAGAGAAEWRLVLGDGK
jgi:hypothetical protein